MFSLLEVFTTKVNFNILREHILKSQNFKIDSKVDIKSKYNKKIKLMEVVLSLEMQGIENNLNILDIEIDTTGIFAQTEDREVDSNVIELFGKIKAPYMLFPFLLEHIHSLSLKAKIKPLIIPYIDFEKIYYENKDFKIVH